MLTGSRIGQVVDVVRAEVGWREIPHRLNLVQLVIRVLPYGAAVRTRMALYRLGGVRIGRGGAVMGFMRLWGTQQLTIGDRTTINTPCAICLDGPVSIGSGVLIGHDTVLATGDHELGPPTERGGRLIPQAIVIEDGVWVGARSLVLRGVTVGRGAVVGAGSVVVHDVPANTVVAGVPARVLRSLET